MKSNMYQVGVIGLGHIAAQYSTPEEETPYCHVGGIRYSNNVELVAVTDIAEPARDEFRTVWGKVFPDIRYYDMSTALLEGEQIDIVAVCVRGPAHFAVTMDVIQAHPRAIFLEKPPTCSLEEMDTMMTAAKANNIPITVSYSRHWCPHVLRLQELVHNGIIGEVKTVVGYVGGSFLSFAGHVTDLICQFAGYCPETVFGRGTVKGDAPHGYEPEPSIESIIIEFSNGVTGVHVGSEGEHGGFYVDVFGTEGRVQAGMYIPPAVYDKEGHPIDLSQYNMPANASVFQIAYDQIADYLDGGPLPHCTNDAWVAVNEIGFAGIESTLTNKMIELPNTNRARKIFADG